MVYHTRRRVEGGFVVGDDVDLPSVMREAAINAAMGELEAARADLPPAIVDRIVELADSLRAIKVRR